MTPLIRLLVTALVVVSAPAHAAPPDLPERAARRLPAGGLYVAATDESRFALHHLTASGLREVLSEAYGVDSWVWLDDGALVTITTDVGAGETTVRWYTSGALARHRTIEHAGVRWPRCSGDDESCAASISSIDQVFAGAQDTVWIRRCRRYVQHELFDPQCAAWSWLRVDEPARPRKAKPAGLRVGDRPYVAEMLGRSIPAPPGITVELATVRDDARRKVRIVECRVGAETMTWPSAESHPESGHDFSVKAIRWLHDEPPIFIADTSVRTWVGYVEVEPHFFVGCTPTDALQWFGAGVWASAVEDRTTIHLDRDVIAVVPEAAVTIGPVSRIAPRAAQP